MNTLIQCRHCGRLFLPNPRVKEQRYCGRPACQRARRAAWQRHKMAVDPAYQDNQRRCQRQWRRQNPGYWSQYRSRHPAYVKRNRELQRLRDLHRRRCDLAKMDASELFLPFKAGGYYLIPQEQDLAKMDVLGHKVFLIPATYGDLAKNNAIDFPRLPCLPWQAKGGFIQNDHQDSP